MNEARNQFAQELGYKGYQSRAAVAASLGAIEGKRQPEVQRELDRHEGLIHAIETSLEQLEKRLSETVLSAAVPTMAGSGKDIAAAVPNCGLGSRIKESSGRLGRVHERLIDLTARLEV